VRANEPLTSPFNLRLGVNGFGICAAGAKADNAGATQVNVFVGVGSYITRLRLVGANGADLLPAHEMPLRVTREEPL
jgi:hypothetical protein